MVLAGREQCPLHDLVVIEGKSAALRDADDEGRWTDHRPRCDGEVRHGHHPPAIVALRRVEDLQLLQLDALDACLHGQPSTISVVQPFTLVNEGTWKPASVSILDEDDRERPVGWDAQDGGVHRNGGARKRRQVPRP
jgi:hypothetical protein